MGWTQVPNPTPPFTECFLSQEQSQAIPEGFRTGLSHSVLAQSPRARWVQMQMVSLCPWPERPYSSIWNSPTLS